MNAERVVAILRQTELFGALAEGPLRRIADQAVVRRYPRGSYVFLQCDTGDRVFVLAEGLLKVLLTSEEGEEMVLATLEPPSSFGELSLVDGRPRSATVQTLSPSTMVSIERAGFLALAGSDRAVAEAVMSSLAGLLRRLTEQASDFVFLDLQGRVAKQLLRLAESRSDGGDLATELDLPLTQGDLARMVGGARQSVNQILGSLERQGLVEIKGRKLLLKDPARLRVRAGL